MKAKPKTVWVVFKDENTPMGAETVNPGKDWYPGCEHVRYHLHPGNEVKLKRENARYRRWLKVLVNPMSIATRIATWTEIRRKEPDLFKAKRRTRK